MVCSDSFRLAVDFQLTSLFILIGGELQTQASWEKENKEIRRIHMQKQVAIIRMRYGDAKKLHHSSLFHMPLYIERLFCCLYQIISFFKAHHQKLAYSVQLCQQAEHRRSGVCFGDLQPKHQPLAFSQHNVQNALQSPTWWDKGFLLQLTLSQQEKTTKRHGSSGAFCLFCGKQTNGSIKAAVGAATYTLGKMAVRFVTFKWHTY